MTRKSCVFCGGRLGRKKSKEHVFPVWLLEVLHFGNATLELGWMSPFGVIKDIRRHTAKASLLGTVCFSCNSGWMSQLETRTKRIFVKALDDGASNIDLTPRETVDLAAWVFKTCAVLNVSSNYRRLFDPRVLRLFGGKREPPATAHIDAEFHPNGDEIAERQSQQLGALVPAGSIDHVDAVKQSFRITIRAGPFTFRLGYSPGDLFIWRQVNTQSIQIWPSPAGRGVTLPRRQEIPNIDQHDLSLYLINTLASKQTSPGVQP